MGFALRANLKKNKYYLKKKLKEDFYFFWGVGVFPRSMKKNTTGLVE